MPLSYKICPCSLQVGNFYLIPSICLKLEINFKLQPLSNFTAIFPWSVAVAVLSSWWLFFSSSQPIKTLPTVRPANDNPFILSFHQSNKIVACDCHCFKNCLISKVCAQISNSLSYIQISKRPSAAKLEISIRLFVTCMWSSKSTILVNIFSRKINCHKNALQRFLAIIDF